MKNKYHIWEKLEISFYAEKDYNNPYMDVDVWVDLKGPNFSKRVYGFWNGKNEFCVRVTATNVGKWLWTSGSNQKDSGLNNKEGSFTAIDWTDEEKMENPCRRGFIKPDCTGHAFEYADGTSYFLLGDTWWATPTYRFPWYDDDHKRPFGPDMGFKDMVAYRKKQRFNAIAMLAALPNWANDGKPPFITKEDDGISIRAAWKQAGTDSAKDMHNEGGRPFQFPGKVPGYEDVFPDVDRINPEYFKYMDRKVDYLNEQGMIAFIEVSRRDASEAWKKYYKWPDSYARYIQYVFARYQANNCLLSPIHFDWHKPSIPSRAFNDAANLVVDRYGHPPFGTLVGTNASPSSLVNFGDDTEARWQTFHQTGNMREHDYNWYLTEIFHSKPPKPAFNGEPYDPGFPDDNPPEPSEEANLNCRSGLYGSVLSGGLAGYIYGAEGLWGADVEDEAKYKIWDALAFKSGTQIQFVLDFFEPFGDKYKKLVPNADLITPNKMGDPMGYRGWAYCSRTEEKDLFLVYFEKDFPKSFGRDMVMRRLPDNELPRAIVRGAELNAKYKLTWFNTETGEWLKDKEQVVESDMIGRVFIMDLPTENDWALSLELVK